VARGKPAAAIDGAVHRQVVFWQRITYSGLDLALDDNGVR